MSPLPPARVFTSYIQAQLTPKKGAPQASGILPAITISRQAGAQGNTVARLLVEFLNESRPPETPRWVLFNENLMSEVFRSSQLPPELERFFPEARVSEWDSTVHSVINDRPDPWIVFEHTCATIEHLLREGHCIVVGRAAHRVGADVAGAFHVRLIGSVEKRLERLLELHPEDPESARRRLERTDRDRRAYARHYFNRDIDDPADYSLVCNTDGIPPERIAAGIARMVDEGAPRREPRHSFRRSRIAFRR